MGGGTGEKRGRDGWKSEEMEGGMRGWDGGVGGLLLGQIHFKAAIFSFVFLQHFTAIYEDEKWRRKKGKTHPYTRRHTPRHTHTH